MLRDEPIELKLYWALTDFVEACIVKSLKPNLTHINQGRPYQIVWNLKKVWPKLQILSSSTYENIISQQFKVN